MRPSGAVQDPIGDLMLYSIARNDGDSDPIMDEALRRVRQGK
ncbi:hypothetical protein [Streptomyces griseiscabiei]|uniref:Transcriptional regulator n=1 Tax=Streptomyces griseiscabiei TaxID=2993540 RepID=A0ABU4LJI0_9ACTN|nr:hypothetical protein [Streptomyces griseiscabiei]MDX2915971.1 hypothetical protein [Streptomyces griseiscabiei]